MYIASANGKTWANPFIRVLPPFRNQYLCVDAEKALSRLPMTLVLSLLLIGFSIYALFVASAAPLLGFIVLLDALLRRLLVPSSLVASASFAVKRPCFSHVLALDFLLNYVAIAGALLAFALDLSAGWGLLACLLAAFTLGIGLLPMVSRALASRR